MGSRTRVERQLAKAIIRSHIAAPSASDSNRLTLFVVEAIIAAIQNDTWADTKQRMNSLEKLFVRTKLSQ